MAQPGIDQHKGGAAVWETAHHSGAAADLPIKPFYDIIGTDACPVFAGKTAVGKRLLNAIFLAASFSFMERSSSTTAFAFSQEAFLLS